MADFAFPQLSSWSPFHLFLSISKTVNAIELAILSDASKTLVKFLQHVSSFVHRMKRGQLSKEATARGLESVKDLMTRLL